MHSGCSGSFDDGKQVVDKLRMMGFSEGLMPVPAEFDCEREVLGELEKMDKYIQAMRTNWRYRDWETDRKSVR